MRVLNANHHTTERNFKVVRRMHNVPPPTLPGSKRPNTWAPETSGHVRLSCQSSYPGAGRNGKSLSLITNLSEVHSYTHQLHYYCTILSRFEQGLLSHTSSYTLSHKKSHNNQQLHYYSLKTLTTYPVFLSTFLNKAEQDREREREQMSQYGREELERQAREERWNRVSVCLYVCQYVPVSVKKTETRSLSLSFSLSFSHSLSLSA